MAYEKNGTITAADFNALATRAKTLYGVGNGDYGYGQASYSLGNVSAGDTVTSSQWTTLNNMMTACSLIQGVFSYPIQPPNSLLEPGDLITAHESSAPSSNAYDINGLLSTLENGRFSTPLGVTQVNFSAQPVEANFVWGYNLNPSVTIGCEIVFEWPSADTARYFFNSGGYVYILMQHTNVVTTQDNYWNDILLNRVGSIVMYANLASHSGFAGTVNSALGYYQLATSEQNVYSGASIGADAYWENSAYCNVRYFGSTANGAKGHQVVFRPWLTDPYWDGGVADLVSAGVRLTGGYAYNPNHSGLTVPTFGQSIPWGWV